jgi:hypothetical protein
MVNLFGLDAACMWLKVTSSPRKCNAVMGSYISWGTYLHFKGKF